MSTTALHINAQIEHAAGRVVVQPLEFDRLNAAMRCTTAE
jgi:hypothetical protein